MSLERRKPVGSKSLFAQWFRQTIEPLNPEASWSIFDDGNPGGCFNLLAGENIQIVDSTNFAGWSLRKDGVHEMNNCSTEYYLIRITEGVVGIG